MKVYIYRIKKNKCKIRVYKNIKNRQIMQNMQMRLRRNMRSKSYCKQILKNKLKINGAKIKLFNNNLMREIMKSL